MSQYDAKGHIAEVVKCEGDPFAVGHGAAGYPVGAGSVPGFVTNRITDPSIYQDKRFRQDAGWNTIIHYDQRSLTATEEALERLRVDLESQGLFTKEVHAIWDAHYNYLKNYQPR
jgi:hypothetical protein